MFARWNMDRTHIARLETIAVALVVLAFPHLTATARNYDPRLEGFVSFTSNGDTEVDYPAFRDYARELSLVFAPKFIGPAATLGSKGFELSLDLGLTTINKDKWQNASINPGSVVTVTQVRIAKGLPYSMQISGIITHIFESSLWAMGLELQAAVLEGIKYAPDIRFGVGVGTLLNSGDLAILLVSPSAIISKEFNVVGLFTLAPFAGYNMIYTNASSHLGGKVYKDNSGAISVKPFVIEGQNIFSHRAVLGLQAKVTYIVFGTELSLGKGQTSYTFKFGTAF
jgi:hypothetical protein